MSRIITLLFCRYVITVYWGGRIIRHRSWTQRDAAEWASAYDNVDALPCVSKRY